MRLVKLAILEALLISGIGVALALLGNALSPRGLSISRNYFPHAPGATANFPVPGSSPANVMDAAAERLKSVGLQPINGDEVLAKFKDPAYQQGRVLIVDARNDKSYQAGHIPGAWQFDHYHPENYVSEVIPVCLSAQQVIVYCGGGSCEDSEFAAKMLGELGVPAERLFVYLGGMKEWKEKRLPLESGPRLSGQLLNP